MSAAEKEEDYLWEKRHATLYRAQLSALYHKKRERFFDLLDKSASAIAIIGGSTAFADLSNPILIKVCAAVITITSTLALVFGVAEKSRRHADLSRQFREVEGRIVFRGERDFTEDDIRQWDLDIRVLEGSEPATLSALVVLCQNELHIASSHPELVVPIDWFRGLFVHFFDLQAKSPKGSASN